MDPLKMIIWLCFLGGTIAVGTFAYKAKGRNPIGWGLLALMLIPTLTVGMAALTYRGTIDMLPLTTASSIFAAFLVGAVLCGAIAFLPDRRGGRAPADRRPCPYCAEPIRTAAKVCRYCGREIAPGNLNEQRATPTVNESPTPP